MIQSVEVENFQSLKHVTLRFGNVTVLVGDSNVGKTALMRAIRGLVENWSAGSLVRQGESRLRVVVKTKDHVIEWHKGQQVNTYVVDGVIMKGVGRESPIQVQSFLGMMTKRILGVEFNPNFRDQFSPPMLVHDSESERLLKLAAISGVGLIQTALRIASKDRKSDESETKAVVQQIQDKDSALKAYAGVEGKDEIVSKLERDLKIFREREQRLSMLTGLIEQRASLQKVWIAYELAVQDKERASRAFRLKAALHLMDLKSQSQATLPTVPDRARRERLALSMLLALRRWDVLLAGIALDGLIARLKHLRLVVDSASMLEVALRALSTGQVDEANEIEGLTIARNNKSSLLATLEICPLCGAKVGATHEGC